MKTAKPEHNLPARTLPSGWREVKLGDVSIKIIDGDRGKNYPKENDFSNQGYCVFLNTKNVTESGFSFSALNFITKEKDEVLKKGQLKRKDTILTTRGTVGNVAFYNEKVPYKNIRINSGMVIIRPIGINEVFNYYLFKHLNSNFSNFASGSAQPQLPIRDLKEVAVLLPPLPEQKAIAEVLSSLDDKIDLLHRQNKTLENMAQALFRQWFIDEADKSWGEKPLGDLVSVKRGGSPRPIQEYISDSGYRWLKISDATKENSPFIFEIKEHIKETGLSKTTLKKSGSLVLSNSATPGIPKILQVDSCIHDGWLHFPESYFSNEFLYLLFKSIRPALLIQGNGSIFINLKTDIIKEYKILVPTKIELNKFQSLVKIKFEKLLSNATQIRTLENLRDMLLPKLMSGKIRIKHNKR